MKNITLFCLLLIGCKSTFFALDHPLPDYDANQKIIILKLSKQAPEYFIFKARAEDYRIPFYLKTAYKFTVGETVFYAQIAREQYKIKYF